MSDKPIDQPASVRTRQRMRQEGRQAQAKIDMDRVSLADGKLVLIEHFLGKIGLDLLDLEPHFGMAGQTYDLDGPTYSRLRGHALEARQYIFDLADHLKTILELLSSESGEKLVNETRQLLDALEKKGVRGDDKISVLQEMREGKDLETAIQAVIPKKPEVKKE